MSRFKFQTYMDRFTKKFLTMTVAIGILGVKFTRIKLFKSFWTNYSLRKSAIATEESAIY
ncbi:hypothetical protein C5E19_07960 [Pectobacterium parmentieri]|nr:hypothetical protein C5E19_07960 [Pectobacterium parmentieri]